MRRLLFREIRRNPGRFFAIMAIIALGVGFFAGLKVTETAMLKTGQDYLEEQKFYHFRLLSTLGLTQEDVDAGKVKNTAIVTGPLAPATAVLFYGVRN